VRRDFAPLLTHEPSWTLGLFRHSIHCFHNTSPVPHSRGFRTSAIMVLLTMTSEAVSSIARLKEIAPDELYKLQLPSEPSLSSAALGNPISHSQLIDISKLLKTYSSSKTPTSPLSALLRGSKVYVPPPPPKKEPVRFPSCLEYRKSFINIRRPPNIRL